MIISASRRTDIPTYYSEWFVNRIRAGYCEVRNPFNPKQISRIDLRPESVDAIVFWTRNPRPLLKYLNELDLRGYKYYFQYTLNNYPRIYESNRPTLESATETFVMLSKRIGSGKVIWRYDPILFTNDLTLDFHERNFGTIAERLAGSTRRVVISIIDDYKKTVRRLNKLNVGYFPHQENSSKIEILLKRIVQIANKYEMEVKSCAEPKDYSYLGVLPGKCIDDELIRKELGVNIEYKKDKGQRAACRCTVSKDIGAVNTCLMGCKYCYATQSQQTALNNWKRHNPNLSAMIG
jgi:hypothetical protein